MKYLIICFLCLVGVTAHGQNSLSPRINAMGGNGVALQDAWNIQNNQSAIAALKTPVASVAFESNYLNPEVNTKSALIVYPYKSNAFGVSVQSYGFSAYSEQKISSAYAKNFGNKLYLSLGLNYHQIKIAQYGTSQAITVQTGVQFFATEKLLFGAFISNPNGSKFSNELNVELPVYMSFGASYKFTDKVLLTSSVSKELYTNTDVQFGLEYKLVPWFALRGGTSANPFKQYAGFGITYNGFNLDGAVSSHPALGYTPQLSLSYEF